MSKFPRHHRCPTLSQSSRAPIHANTGPALSATVLLQIGATKQVNVHLELRFESGFGLGLRSTKRVRGRVRGRVGPGHSEPKFADANQ